MRIALTLLMAGSLAALVHADDWPNWRGPASSGITTERGLPERWSDTANIAWKARLDGLGISSPIVSGDLVFVTSQQGNGEVRPGPRLRATVAHRGSQPVPDPDAALSERPRLREPGISQQPLHGGETGRPRERGR